MLLLAVLPLVLRLALWPFHPTPTPAGGDDFSYLLLGDTLAQGRLANPVHPLHRFFETDFVLQEPSYSSIFAPGQGLLLALGQRIGGHPWAGVLLSGSLFCSLCYWMLRAWTTPEWSLIGGLLAVMQFGPLNQWINTYYGGMVSAAAGCVIFGALPRLKNTRFNKSGGKRYALLLGAGLGVQVLARPFETVLIGLGVLAYLVWEQLPFWRTIAVAALAAAPAFGFILLHNHAVTGQWMKLPYMESRDQYGVPTTFTFQRAPVPGRTLTREQQLDYRAQTIIHGDGRETVAAYFLRLVDRFQSYRFFFLPPLYLGLGAFLWRWKQRPYRWTASVVVIVALGTNFYPYFYPHYVAALTCVFVLISVAGLERWTLWPRFGWVAKAVFTLCVAQFAFFYGAHFSRNVQLLTSLEPYESPNYINWGDPEGRSAINSQLEALTGQQLVFVRYTPKHLFREWVHNAADIDSAHVVWARDLGAAENEVLRHYYPKRTAWLLEPDVFPPKLAPYRLELEPPPAEPEAVSRTGTNDASSKESSSGNQIQELPESGFVKNKREKQ